MTGRMAALRVASSTESTGRDGNRSDCGTNHRWSRWDGTQRDKPSGTSTNRDGNRSDCGTNHRWSRQDGTQNGMATGVVVDGTDEMGRKALAMYGTTRAARREMRGSS